MVDSDVTASRVDRVDSESTEWRTAVNEDDSSAFIISWLIPARLAATLVGDCAAKMSDL